MKKQIFPKEFIENTYEAHQFRHSKQSQKIHILLLLLFLGTAESLPFIKVNVNTSARALYQNPEILIFDEATSSLDSKYEQYIQKTMQQLCNEKKTIILIVHRLSTVVQADEIVVLEKGKVVEKGNHEDLLQQKVCYHAL